MGLTSAGVQGRRTCRPPVQAQLPVEGRGPALSICPGSHGWFRQSWDRPACRPPVGTPTPCPAPAHEANAGRTVPNAQGTTESRLEKGSVPAQPRGSSCRSRAALQRARLLVDSGNRWEGRGPPALVGRLSEALSWAQHGEERSGPAALTSGPGGSDPEATGRGTESPGGEAASEPCTEGRSAPSHQLRAPAAVSQP